MATEYYWELQVLPGIDSHAGENRGEQLEVWCIWELYYNHLVLTQKVTKPIGKKLLEKESVEYDRDKDKSGEREQRQKLQDNKPRIQIVLYVCKIRNTILNNASLQNFRNTTFI